MHNTAKRNSIKKRRGRKRTDFGEAIFGLRQMLGLRLCLARRHSEYVGFNKLVP
jgi:hypothetical protein